jgi:beta-glucosidase
LNDADRVEFIKGNLTAVWLAIQQGVNIKLYTYWSLADNFEWAEGFDSRFGLIWIDYEHNFSRLLKSSYYYYQKVIKKNRVVQ